MKKKRVTIKCIAEKLDVTPATVSKALRDSSDISEGMRKRVKTVAEEMGYKPNFMAQSLVRRRSYLLGVVVPNLRISFFSEVTRGIYETARAMGYEAIILANDESMETERRNLEFLVSLNVDGILINAVPGTDNNDLFGQIRRRGIPLVCYDRHINEMEFPSVTIDDTHAAFEVMSHFIQHGRKDILFLGPTETLTVAKGRYEGYRKALDHYGLTFRPDRVVQCDLEPEDAKRAMRSVLVNGERPDAVMCIGGLVAYGAGLAIREAGIRVPEQLMIAEFGDNDIVYRLGVSFITVNQSPYAMGRESVHLVLKYIEDSNRTLPQEHRLIDTKLIVRDIAGNIG